MSLGTKHFYEFQDFRLDVGERELRRGGTPVPLTPKAFHLLKILVENHGHIVDKEKLISEIWAGSFVEDGNLAVSATALRKALNDSASNPTFIETVPRRGYRFVADVTESKVDVPNDIPDSLPERHSDERVHVGRHVTFLRRPYQRYATVLITVLVAAAGITAWYAQKKLAGPSLTSPILSSPFAASKLHSSSDIRIAMSPGGDRVAFTDEAGGMRSVWLRTLDSGENIQIVPPSNDLYYDLAFSQDGNTIYFVRRPRESHSDLALYRVSSSGGIPVIIHAAPLDWISVSPDDKQIAFIQCNYKPDDFCALFTMDADGQNKKQLVSRPGSIQLVGSHFSPDGKSIAFLSGRGGGSEPGFELAQVNLESGEETVISPQRFYEVSNMKWLPSGAELLLTVREYEDGTSSIWKVSVPDGEATRVTKDAANYQEINLDRAATKMAAVQMENDFNIFVETDDDLAKLTTAKEISIAPNDRFIYSTFGGDIWSIDARGGERRQLTTGAAGDFSPKPSLDGRYIFFTSNRSGSQQVWRIASDGSNPVQITKTGGRPCGVTPDGKWLYYQSFERRLGRISTDGGDEFPLNYTSRVTRPACSPDGSFIAYFFLDKTFKIGILNTADGSVVKTMEYGDGKALPGRLAWSSDSRTLNYVMHKDGATSLWKNAMDAENPTLLRDLGSDEVRDLAVMPDGRVAFVRGKWIHNAVLLTGLE